MTKTRLSTVMGKAFTIAILTATTLFCNAAEKGRTPIPGTPGFEALFDGREMGRALVILVPQQSLPLGAGKLCISTKGGRWCSRGAGPYGQRWDAPRAFYFHLDDGLEVPERGVISILLEGGEEGARFDCSLAGIAQLLSD